MKLFTATFALVLSTLTAQARRLDFTSLEPTSPLADFASKTDTEWRDNNISDNGGLLLEGFRLEGAITEKGLMELAGDAFRNNSHQVVTDEEVLEGTTRIEKYSKNTTSAIAMALAVANAYNTDNPDNIVEFVKPLKKLAKLAGITAANATVVHTCTVFTTLEDGEDGAKNSSYDVLQYIVFNNETREGFTVFAKEGQMGEGPGHVNAGLCK